MFQDNFNKKNNVTDLCLRYSHYKLQNWLMIGKSFLSLYIKWQHY